MLLALGSFHTGLFLTVAALVATVASRLASFGQPVTPRYSTALQMKQRSDADQSICATIYNKRAIFIDMNPNVDLLGDPARRSMLALLAVEGEVCVCEFVAALEELQPSVSRNLGLLREGGWITSRREGTWVHYRLVRLPKWAQTMLDGLVIGGVPPEVMREARSRLAAFPGRPLRTRRRVA